MNSVAFYNEGCWNKSFPEKKKKKFKEVGKVFACTDPGVRIAVTPRQTDTLTSRKSAGSKPFKCCRMQFFRKKRHTALKLSITSGFNIESLHRRQTEEGGVGGRRRRTDIYPVCIYIIRLRLLLFLLQASPLLASESVFVCGFSQGTGARTSVVHGALLSRCSIVWWYSDNIETFPNELCRETFSFAASLLMHINKWYARPHLIHWFYIRITFSFTAIFTGLH